MWNSEVAGRLEVRERPAISGEPEPASRSEAESKAKPRQVAASTRPLRGRLSANGSLTLVVATLSALAFSPVARAQTGFALDRFYPSPAGGGFFVMDDLDTSPGLGGAVSLSTWFARNPLVISEGGNRLTAVANEAFADLAASVWYSRLRLSIDFPMPLAVYGDSGTIAGTAFVGPAVNLATNPDSITDVRIGLDFRLYGVAGDPLRLGLSAQLLVPSGSPLDTPANYLTDGTVRAMFRALAAGDLGDYRYAAQLGVHIRPLDSPLPEAPEGSEFLFGAAIAYRTAVLLPGWAILCGPEVYGQSALRAFGGETTTGVEGLLTGRLEGTGQGAQARYKVGVGIGINPQFGTPQWRVVLSAELFSHEE